MAYDWVPKTKLGKSVMNGEITSLDKIFEQGYKITEPEIVEKLLPGLKTEIVFIGGSPGKGGGIKRTPTRRTARMHRSGRKYKISALVIAGNEDGYVGIGKAVGTENRIAIEKATKLAKINIIPVQRGCGSWECNCHGTHSIPFTTSGKSGSNKIVLMPAPKGIGLCIGDEGKKLMRLAGIRDIWVKSYGNTRARVNFLSALFNVFKNINKTKT